MDGVPGYRHGNILISCTFVQMLTLDSETFATIRSTRFGRYPGFVALLPPEAEMWTDQELDADVSEMTFAW